jgi:hypothetical protein
VEAPTPLAPEEALRLTEFARAFKAAARAVVLYPATHPAIATTLGRIVALTSAESLPEPLRVGVLADTLVIDGKAPSRADPAIVELATLLHDHLIGELTVHPGGDLEAWRVFLLLLGRAPDTVRADGGIAHLWATMAGQHVEIREIDYAEVLRERRGGEAAAWDQVIANCLQGDASRLDEEALNALLDASANSKSLAELMQTLDARAVEAGRAIPERTEALVQLLKSVVQAVSERQPERLEAVLRNVAEAVGQLSPDLLTSLLSRTDQGTAGGASAEPAEIPRLVNAIASHMSDQTIATFVARNALSSDSSLERVAQAFHSLVRDADDRERLLAMAHDEASAAVPAGGAEAFEEAWEAVAEKMITSYSDKPYVSDDYARELSGSRTRAIDIDQIKDDPPDRIAAWVSTVSTPELRQLDLALVLDLLRIEQDTERWSLMMRPVVQLIQDQLLIGDFAAAADLVGALLRHTSPETPRDRWEKARAAVDELVRGPLMRHIASHMPTIDDVQFERVKAMCVSIGEGIIRPLAESIAIEERARPRERLTAILMAFGASGKQEVERLKSSPNAAVRRTAVYLLREFGGSEALPELAGLLSDAEQQVQREAVRAILRIGTDAAYQVLEKALLEGTEPSRNALMQALTLARDERAAPVFSHILNHVDHKGELGSIYLRAIEGLGALRDVESVPALKAALYRGEWWAPKRTAVLRGAAAEALSRIGAPEALAVLEEAAASKSRGIRTAARTHLRAAQMTRSRTSS